MWRGWCVVGRVVCCGEGGVLCTSLGKDNRDVLTYTLWQHYGV